MKFSKLVLSGVLGIALLSATSCGTPKNVAYFQDLNNNPDTVITLQNRVITVKPTDKIYIGVKSKDPQISQLFNLTGGTSGSGANNMSQDAYYYTVDSKGEIDFPVVGKIQVAGLTREEIAEKVKKSLVDASLVKDPTVTVSLSHLHYSMMGEVAKPGQYAIEEEKLTILDAISKAGDLTIQGRRNDVMVLRQENGHQKIYKIDLCSGKDIFSSPAYYLQQNDVVYVTPNKTKAKNASISNSTTIWFSVVGTLVSRASLIVTISR